MSERYFTIGRLSGIEWERREPGIGLVAEGTTLEPIWGCGDCGAVVWLKDTHDQFHEGLTARAGIADARASLASALEKEEP